MKIQFKVQPFQQEASKAICDVFSGQPKKEGLVYTLDVDNSTNAQICIGDHNTNSNGYNNAKFEIDDNQILKNIQAVQRNSNNIIPSSILESNTFPKEVEDQKGEKSEKNVSVKYNFSVEMETGTGKTYTYIKTMFDLNERYGWTKFIIVVPSVAIREGVSSTLDATSDHFSEMYQKKIKHFVYNSSDLTKIDDFASDNNINVMVINSQAFNSKGKDARRIYQNLDSFRSRRPIDILASTNPILIIDEPQSVEGEKTKASLTEFNPLFTLRYSATHKVSYNMLYRLDALDAYNQKLVKKISAKCISIGGSTGTESYLDLKQIITSTKNLPVAEIEFEVSGKTNLRKKTKKLSQGADLYVESQELEEYKGYVIADINAKTDTVSFTNGVTIYTGMEQGKSNDQLIRRLQIRETIKSHIEKEKELYCKGIKVISLFFIDEVAKYRVYDESYNHSLGEYAQMFQEEYATILAENLKDLDQDDDLYKYLSKIEASQTHKGYFSIDKNKKTSDTELFVDSKITDKKEKLSDDADAYNLIMKDKEKLLSFDEKTRFIFSHSALREGWDNPNVFQICSLKKLSESDIRSRQEIGRGLRLSVDQNGNRQDVGVLGTAVHELNKLTIIAESNYEEYVKQIQKGIADTLKDRPKKIDQNLFKDKVIKNATGDEITVSEDLADEIFEDLIEKGYIKKGKTTDKYTQAIATETFALSEELQEYTEQIIKIINMVCDETDYKVDDENKTKIEVKMVASNFNKLEFQALWDKINLKTAYTVNFDDKEIIEKSIEALDEYLHVSKIYFNISEGEMAEIKSKEALSQGESFSKTTRRDEIEITANSNVKYDLIGKIVNNTELTRKTVAQILSGIKEDTFNQYKQNPEEFITKASNLINEQKATLIVEKIEYTKLGKKYSDDIFKKANLKGKLGDNAYETNNPNSKNIFDHLIYDSDIELKMGIELEASEAVLVYVKLPSQFYVNTPFGKYNPDWAITFEKDDGTQVYVVAETKGSTSTSQLRGIEKAKNDCAKKHFAKISTDTVQYMVVDKFDTLLTLVFE